MEKEKVCGIYKIENKVNGKLYIGQSEDVYQRLKSHNSLLRFNHHKNKLLQAEFNEYGIDNFIFEVIETGICPLCIREIYYINLYETKDSTKGYNCNFNEIQRIKNKIYRSINGSIGSI